MENQTDSIDKLAEALSKAQAEIIPPIKNRAVKFTDKNGRKVEYAYADLADVIEALKPLAKHGLSISHKMKPIDGVYTLITTLMHSSGQKDETWYPLPDPRSIKPQEFGSSLTYGRRYSVSMITGIASEEDDDGQAAQAPEAPQPKKPQAMKPQTPAIEPQMEEEMVPLLVKVVRFANEKQIPNEEMKTIIKRVTGSEKKSTELNNEELEQLLKYLHLSKSGIS